MSDSKRQCSTCQFFQKAQLAGNGWCTHPKRQLASDVRILVREKELACRNSWGDDLWADRLSSTTTSPEITPLRRGFVYINQRLDDEVTSVVDATSRQSTESEPAASGSRPVSEDVVTMTSVRPDPTMKAKSDRQDDLNSPANADQDERVRLMARGSKLAVAQARERHAQRRGHSRPSPDPESPPPDPQADQVITAQHRDQYDHNQARINRSSDVRDGDAHESTPPVPRSEVEAAGNALSPVRGKDSRFDTVPDLDPEIDLPRFREFFNTDVTGKHRAGTTGEASPPVTSFDLVLKRAQEIKAASKIERQALIARHPGVPKAAPAPAAEPGIESAPVTSVSAAPSQADVVWDVESTSLDIAFERARAAIDQTVSDLSAMAEVTAPVNAVVEHEIALTEHEFDSDVDSDYEEEAYDEQFRNPSYTQDLRPDSPRGSWWRSLNFGRKRRAQVQAEAPDPYQSLEAEFEDYEDYEDYGVTDLSYGDPITSEHDVYEPVAEYVGEDVAAFADHPTSDILEPLYSTTEDSWLQDEREFPEPQPAEWHETRTQLRTTQPAPDDLADEFSTTAWSYPVSAVESEPAVVHVEPPVPVRREPSPFFAIDEPSGMDAFRAALFGDFSESSSEPLFAMANRVSANVDSEFTSASFTGEDRHQAQNDDLYESTYANPERSRGSRDRRRSTPATQNFAHNETAFNPNFDIRDAIVDQDDEDIERIFAVASSVPKACSTCRSFRPAESGDRGWCTNDWAFTHRQMVNADDLPCRSSIGDWWLAADTSWIPPVDPIQPETPRTDRLVARSDSLNQPERPGERRVRTRKVV